MSYRPADLARAAAASFARRVFAAAGLSAVRSSQTYGADRAAILRRRGIDLVVDVGANRGQYAEELRRGGYAGRIFSIEPLPDAFASLKQTRGADPCWSGLNAAAGPTAGRAQLNVSEDSVCSSLLKPSSALIDTIPTARTVNVVEVDVIRLDMVALPTHRAACLKLDVQGFEEDALAGASGLLPSLDVVEMELSAQLAYERGFTLSRALSTMEKHGFSMTTIGRGVSNPTSGRLIDLDVLFERALANERSD